MSSSPVPALAAPPVAPLPFTVTTTLAWCPADPVDAVAAPPPAARAPDVGMTAPVPSSTVCPLVTVYITMRLLSAAAVFFCFFFLSEEDAAAEGVAPIEKCSSA